MTFYSDMATVALNLLSEFGQSATLTRKISGTYNHTTGKVTGATDDPQTVKAVFADYSLKDSGKGFEPETQILRGDKKIIIAASGLSWAPEPNHTINDTWTLMNVKEVNPAGTPLIYECLGRR